MTTLQGMLKKWWQLLQFCYKIYIWLLYKQCLCKNWRRLQQHDCPSTFYELFEMMKFYGIYEILHYHCTLYHSSFFAYWFLTKLYKWLNNGTCSVTTNPIFTASHKLNNRFFNHEPSGFNFPIDATAPVSSYITNHWNAETALSTLQRQKKKERRNLRHFSEIPKFPNG